MFVVNPAGLALTDITTTVPENDAASWTAGVSFDLGDRVVRTHRVFQSTVEDNLGNDPDLEDQNLVDAKWLEVRYTNAFTCFDGVLANKTQATRTGPDNAMAGNSVNGTPPVLVLDFESELYVDGDWSPYLELGLNPAAAPMIADISGLGNVDTIMLFGISAYRVEVVALNSVGQVLSRRGQSMSARQVASYYEWFTTPPEAVSDRLVMSDLPAATTRLIVSLEGATVSIGEIVIGRSLMLAACSPIKPQAVLLRPPATR